MDVCGLHNVIKKQGVAINEICTDTAATRTTDVRTEEDNKNFRQETEGYSGITFIVNVLAASFGIEERELLRGGIQNREEYKRALTKYISTGADILLRNVDLLECNLDILFTSLYRKKNNSINETMIASSFEQIHDYIYEILKMRIAFDIREINKESAERLAYDYQKIETIIVKTIGSYGVFNYMGKETKDKLCWKTVEKELEIVKQISDIITLVENKAKITNEQEWQEAEKMARCGEYLDTVGTESEKDKKNRFRLVEEYPKTNHEFDYVTQWDNETVIKIMKQLWRNKEVVDVGKEILFEKMGGFFSIFKNRKQRKLNAPGENGEGGFVELKSDFDERCKVSPEQLEPLKPSAEPKGIESEKESGKE